MSKIKVFISSRIKELQEERELIWDLIKNEMGLEAILFEKEPPASEHLKKWWRDKIRNSKFYILLLGKEISQPVFDEFQTAIKYSKKIIILVKNEETIKNEELEFEFEIQPKEKEMFYKKITHHKYKPFRDEAELKDNIRKGLVQYLDVLEDIDQEFHHKIVSVDGPEYRKIDMVYVKPKVYFRAYEIVQEKNLIILYGPPHVGKTITARKLAIDLTKNPFLDRILELEPADLARLRNVKNSVIFIDDAFKPKYEFGRNRIKNIETLSKNNNYFILTSTRDLLLDAKRELETEFLVENRLVELGEDDYTKEDLRKILENHLRYHNIVKEKQRWILRNSEFIVNRLNFPHNIEFFVRCCIPEIKDRDSLIEGVKRAKTIEGTVKNWFIGLDSDTKYFLITIALFGEFDREKYSQLLKSVDRKSGNLDKIKKVIEPYVIVSTSLEEETIKFRHESYRDGILQGILEEHWEEVGKFLLDLIRTTNHKLRFTIRLLMLRFAMNDSQKVVKILKSWTEREMDIRRLVAESLVFVSMEAPDEILQLAKELLKDDDRFIKSRCIMTIGRIGRQRPFEALEILKDVLLHEKNKNIQYFVELSLNRIYRDNPVKVLPIFKQWIKYHPELKINIARSIGQSPIDDEGIYGLLRDFVLDTDDTVAEAAVSVLRSFLEWGSWQIFDKLKKDENPRVRIAILRAFQSLGTIMFPPKHDDALISFIEARKIAEELNNDEDETVKQMAQTAIKKLNEQIMWAKEYLDQFYEDLAEKYHQLYLDKILNEAHILALLILNYILDILNFINAEKEIGELKEYMRKYDENFYKKLIEFNDRSKIPEIEPIIEDNVDFAILMIRGLQREFEENAQILLDSSDAEYINAIEKYRNSVHRGLRKLRELDLLR